MMLQSLKKLYHPISYLWESYLWEFLFGFSARNNWASVQLVWFFFFLNMGCVNPCIFFFNAKLNLGSTYSEIKYLTSHELCTKLILTLVFLPSCLPPPWFLKALTFLKQQATIYYARYSTNLLVCIISYFYKLL